MGPAPKDDYYSSKGESFLKDIERCRKWKYESGVDQQPFILQPGEHIVKIISRAGDSLDMIQFVTNHGRNSPKYGNAKGGSPQPNFECADGSYIWAVERQKGYRGRIIGLRRE